MKKLICRLIGHHIEGLGGGRWCDYHTEYEGLCWRCNQHCFAGGAKSWRFRWLVHIEN